MPVTFLVNRNVQGIPQFASNLVPNANSTMFDSIADSSGNFYTCGTYTASAQVNISNGVLGAAPTLIGQTCSLPNPGSIPSAYVVKYNSAGTAQWAWSFIPTTTGPATAYNIVLDQTSSNIYVLVNYISNGGTVTITNGATNTTGTAGTSTNITVPTEATGTGGTVLLKINSLGVVQWVSYYSSNNADTGYAMSVDSLGNLFVCGSTTEAAAAPFNVYNGLASPQGSTTSVTTSTVTVTLPSLGATSVSVGYLLKYSAAGVASTGVILGQTAASGSSSMFSSIVDPTGSFVYVVGQYVNSTALTLFNGSAAGGTASSATIPLTGTTPMGFVIKYTAASLAFVSAAVIGNGATTNNVQIYGSAIAPNGNLYVCGSYTASVNIPIYNAPATAGASQLQASNTISLPLQNTGTLVTGFVAKFNSALTAQYASVINPIGTATSSAMSNVYSVATDSSDVNLFAGIRYVSSNLTSGVNVTSLITTTAATGTNNVVLPQAPSSGFGYVRYFLGNSLHASTFQNTSNIFNGVTIGGQASTNAPLTVFEDPTMTSVYLASSFTSNVPMVVPSYAVTNGLAQPNALFNLTGAGAAIQTPMVIKLS